MLGDFNTNKNSAPINEDIIYEYVLEEMEFGTPNKGLLTKAVLESEGNDDKAKSLYLKYRVEAIEHQIKTLKIDIRKYSKEQIFSFIKNDFKNYKKDIFFKRMLVVFGILFFIAIGFILYLFIPQNSYLKHTNIAESIKKGISPFIHLQKGDIRDSYGNIYKEVTSPYTGKIWLDRNLGASSVCQSFDDEKCFGSYFQWGRGADGHEKLQVKTTTKIAKDSDPGNSKFIVGSAENRYDWLEIQDNTLWKGLYASNNPCPKDFRIPTAGEFKKELIDNGGNNIHKGFKSFLKLPIAGYKNYNSEIEYQGFEGRYWTSSTKSQFALSLNLSSNSGKPYIFFFERANGYSVRCIKDK